MRNEARPLKGEYREMIDILLVFFACYLLIFSDFYVKIYYIKGEDRKGVFSYVEIQN